MVTIMKILRAVKRALVVSYTIFIVMCGYIMFSSSPQVNIAVENWLDRKPDELDKVSLSTDQRGLHYRHQEILAGFMNTTTVIPTVNATPGLYLIYRSDGADLPSSHTWPDHVTGMMMTYLVSTLTSRIFKAEVMSIPCKLTDYVIPGTINWSLPKSFHSFLRKGLPHVGIYNFESGDPFFQSVVTTNFSQFTPSTLAYIYFSAGQDFSLDLQMSTLYRRHLSWVQGLTPHRLYAALFRHLFQLAPRLQKRLDLFLYSILPTPAHRLVCVDLTNRGDYSKSTDQLVTPPTKLVLTSVRNFILQHSKSHLHRVFLLTRSEYVENTMQQHKFRDRLVHSPRSTAPRASSPTETTCHNLEHAVLDQHLMHSCDVLLVSEGMLGRMAAHIRGSDDGLYCLTRSGQIQACKTEELHRLYEMRE